MNISSQSSPLPSERGPDLKYEVLRNKESFLSLRTDWDRIFSENQEDNFYISFDWFYAVIFLYRQYPKNLYVITIRSHGDVVAIIPCCISISRIRFSRKKSLELIGNLYSPYRGCIVKKGQENVSANGFLEFLLESKSGDWDVINFEGLSAKDPFITAFNSAVNNNKLEYMKINQFVNVISDLGKCKDFEDYFQLIDKKRTSIKKQINMLNREGDFEIVLTSKPDHDIEKSIDDYYDIYNRSWKEKEGDPNFHKELARYLIGRGFLRLFILYYRKKTDDAEKPDRPSISFRSYQSSINPDQTIPKDSVPIAAIYFILLKKKAYYVKTAYREDYSKYSPGTVLFWFATKYLLEEDHSELIDHQIGDEKYKFEWAGKIHETRFRLLIANPERLFVLAELWSENHIAPLLREAKKWVQNYRIFRGATAK
jgi:Acetyltransferase (GNAT) domain